MGADEVPMGPGKGAQGGGAAASSAYFLHRGVTRATSVRRLH